MRVTVAICTWNRAELLDGTLAEMRKLEIPAGVEWELVVVNNNCTDHTDAVLDQHGGHLPIRRVLEPKQGHSHARNSAVAAATGDLILWTDDDVLTHPQWLAEYVRAADRWPGASFFGGPIEPYFASTPPQWLAETFSEISGIYAIRNLGDESFVIDADRMPYGANFAIRRAIQARYPFDTRMGRVGNRLMSGEEVAVIAQLLSDGREGRWVPRARVRHYIPENRQTTSYVRGYCFWWGKLDAMRDRDQQQHRDLRSRFWLARQAIKRELAYRVRRVFAGPRVWIKDLRQSAYYWGRLLG